MHMPAIDIDTINSTFTIFVMVATCTAVFISSNTRKRVRSIGESQFGELEESLRKMIERAEDAGSRLSHQLRIEKDELNHLLNELLDAKRTSNGIPPHVSQSHKNYPSLGARQRENEEGNEDLPNESWLKTPAVLNRTKRQAQDRRSVQSQEKLSAMADNRHDDIRLSQESLDLISKRLEKGSNSKLMPKSSSYENPSDPASFGAAYSIARRLLREGKSPEMIARKLELQVNEVLMLASLDDDQNEAPKQYASLKAGR